MRPDLVDSFVYNGRRIGVEWFDASTIDWLPDIRWKQVYAIGNLSGKVPVVYYPEPGHKDNLPGGKFETGETIQQTLEREIVEEINCRVLSWSPIGYQKLTEPDGKVVYQLRVYAELEKIAEFEKDPGGSVIGYRLVDIGNLNTYIRYGAVGDRMIGLVSGNY